MAFTRREIGLGALTLAAAGAAAVAYRMIGGRREAVAGTFEVTHTPEEWRKLLTPEQYAVLREQDTERAFTSPLNNEHRDGTFNCAGCDLPLFSSKTKFDSGTGWPSFQQAVEEDRVTLKTDRSLGMTRTEVLCSRCDAHLGHVFPDGPPPAGLRYCINSVALKLVPRLPGVEK